MPDQDQKKLEIENLEATELEDQDLEDVSGGAGALNECTVVNHCTLPGN